tara:strand:- start:1252 stop:1548 length:297 start_codon:yes stop_codon:yes gene_type:complete
MKFLVYELVSETIRGLKFYFEKNQIEVREEFYKELMNTLNMELSKPFNEQTQTPTQILNDYIKNKLNKNLKISPHELGSEFNNSLVLWGIEKAKFFHD